MAVLPKRRLLSGLLLLVVALFGAALFRRRSTGRGEQVDLYFADGSLTSLMAGTPGADELLGLARDLLREVRP